MSAAGACGWSLCRSLAIAVFALPICVRLARRLSASSGTAGRIGWILLLLPFLFPTLFSGYAYEGANLFWINGGWWKTLPTGWAAEFQGWLSRNSTGVDEALLVLLLVAKSVPAGTLLLALAPRPPFSPSAVHCRRMAQRPDAGVRHGLRVRLDAVRFGEPRSLLAAAALIFLVCFQEFELPSLLQRPAWTVWLFDAQVGGLALSESLRATIFPVGCQVVALVPLWRSLVRVAPGAPAAPLRQGGTPSVASFEFAYLIGAVALTCLVPVWLVGRDVVQGLVALATNRIQLERVVKETLIGTLFAALAAAIALRVASWRPRRPEFLALPGLFGPLVLGLVLVHLLQWPALNQIYRTPVSLVVGLALFLLPRAMLLMAVFQTVQPRAAGRAADLLGEAPDRRRRGLAGEIAWRLEGRATFWALALLTCWGYLELTIAYLLGPVEIVSVPVLLYNQMHFGKNAILSATTFLAVVVPVLLFAGAAALRPLVAPWFRR